MSVYPFPGTRYVSTWGPVETGGGVPGAVITYHLFIAIPANFTGWQANAIQIANRNTIATGGGNTAQVALDLYDPTNDGLNPNFTPPQATASRTLPQLSAESGWSDLTIPSGSISYPYVPGDCLHIGLRMIIAAGAPTYNMRFTDLRVNWQ